MKRNAKFELSPQVYQSRQDLIRAMRNTMHGTKLGNLSKNVGTERQIFSTKLKDEHAEPNAVGLEKGGILLLRVRITSIVVIRLGQPASPFSEISLGGGAVEKEPGRCAEDRTVTAVYVPD